MAAKKYFFVSFVLFTFFISCSREKDYRDAVKVLYYSDQTYPQLESALNQEYGTKDWAILSDTSRAYIRPDSLQKYSALIIPSSQLNKLNYRELNALKRYLEAGGGGTVVVKDEALTRKGWPWLQRWQAMETGKRHNGDLGRLYLLDPQASVQKWSEAIIHAVGENAFPDYKQAQTPAVPDSSRYTREVLVQGLDEPMQMAVLPGQDVLFVERKGAVKLYDAEQKQLTTIAHFDVFSGIEEGLLGVALDPEYSENGWVYMYYSPSDTSVNRLSRLKLRSKELDRTSEQVLLEIPTQRIHCCHSAGYLRFGPGGLLYLATGDNTNADDPYKIGYPPVDERPGHELADDQATAANTNDLRGKILRIKPQPDGSYTIPDGNLFAGDDIPETRPEIYVMGLRNPFRFTVDMKSGILYWGEVGPNTIVTGRDGSKMSYDEINRAAAPGFYGWPYFLGNNDAFPMYNFATGQEGPRKDPAHPINDSPNNTGIQQLPPARPAMIWYGPESSSSFPLVGSGGASLMAGPVYYSDQFSAASYKLSGYYDGKLFIYDWIRNWIMAVTLDEEGKYVRMEPFLEYMDFASPMDMQFGPDGALYVLEYGSNWFSKNVDAKLVRIEYQEGNRNPIAVPRADIKYGKAPLTVQLSAADSKDYDEGDELQYRWLIGSETLRGEQVSHTFDTVGVHEVTLVVEDNQGGKATATITINVGNTPPEVRIASRSNTSFYWDNTTFDYQLKVTDKEDGHVDTSNIQFSFGYVENEKDVPVILSGGEQQKNIGHVKGQQLITSSDCESCHSVTETSVGPSFTAVAKRFQDQEKAAEYLAGRIQKGGSGNWGTRVMPPHPDISAEEAKEMVDYILSIADKQSRRLLSGDIELDQHGSGGAYLLFTSYTDKGAGGIPPLQGEDYIVLRSPRIEAELYDRGDVNVVHIATENRGYINNIVPDSYIIFNQKDLTRVQSMTFRVQPAGPGGTIELRLDKPDGRLVSSAEVSTGDSVSNLPEWQEISVDMEDTKGIHDLYFIFTHPDEGLEENLFNLDWIYFSNE